MTGDDVVRVFAVLGLVLFCTATTMQGIDQSARIDRLTERVERAEQHRSDDLNQIAQLNRRVFGVPAIRQEATR